jgi:hypothetical protein
MIVVPAYKDHRIEVNAQQSVATWDAEVRIRRILSDQKPLVETITCRKPIAKDAEERASIYARRWVDRCATGARDYR